MSAVKKLLSMGNDFRFKIFIATAANSVLHFFLYYSGIFFTPGCVFPLYFTLTPLSYFGSNGIPFFFFDYPFLYFFFYQIIVYYVFQNRFSLVLYFLYSVYCWFNIPTVNYYWDRDINLTFDSYVYQNQYVFPEHMFFINDFSDIDFLRNFAQKTSKEIVAGIGWYERHEKKLIEKNGIIIIDKFGNYKIFEKNHYLRFCETGTSYFYLSNNKNRPRDIYICSEFFLGKIKKININSDVIVASTNWTNTYLTFFYKNIMKRIYDIMIK